MSALLPQRHNIRNFRPGDGDGRALFNNAAKALDDFFADEMVKDLAKSIPYIENCSATTPQEGIAKCLAEILHLHKGFQRLIGESVARGQETPTMSYFTALVESRGNTIDQASKELAAQMNNDRAFAAEDLSQETFKTVLLEFATLDHWLHTDNAFNAYLELDQRMQHQFSTSVEGLPLLRAGMNHGLNDHQKFEFLQSVVAHRYAQLQHMAGVAIPPTEVDALIEHPLTAKLSALNFDDIRHQFVKLDLPKDTPLFLVQLLQPEASKDGYRSNPPLR